jgi:hypothetical protein
VKTVLLKTITTLLRAIFKLIPKVPVVSGLLRDLIEVVGEREKLFNTYHSRPMNSASVCTRSDEVRNQKRLGIVIQGPIIGENDFTLETVKIYKKHFSDALIILSTWEDEDSAAVMRFEELGISVILNEKPNYSGTSNINFQIVSAASGIRKAHELGVEYVLKTRTDQRIYAPNVADYLYNITETFPVSPRYETQRRRIVCISLNTFKYRMYGLSDMLSYGHIDDMLLYWNVDCDNRVFDDEEIQKGSSSLRNFALWRVCEVYLATEFLQKVGRNLEWTLKDSWGAFADHFCIVDKEQLDLFWPKYNRQEYRWLDYTGRINHQEMTFREWFNIYSNLTHKKIPGDNILD